VQELLTSKLDVLASQADAQGVTLSVKVAEDVPVVHLDSEKVAWAVTTLVGNALRYVQAPSRPAVWKSDRRPGHGWSWPVASRDFGPGRGPGIPSDTVSRLFVRDGLNVRGAGLSLLLIGTSWSLMAERLISTAIPSQAAMAPRSG
jgi:C4-dicarboxylate-specific signal transduction histidine kinase